MVFFVRKSSQRYVSLNCLAILGGCFLFHSTSLKSHCISLVQDISKKYNETITTWGYRQGYTSTPLVAKGCCICIHYYVDKDTGGSSYYRDLFIPIEYVTKELEKSDEVYYMDRWAGKGPRFDSQGGTFTVNNTVRQIIKLIKLQK